MIDNYSYSKYFKKISEKQRLQNPFLVADLRYKISKKLIDTNFKKNKFSINLTQLLFFLYINNEFNEKILIYLNKKKKISHPLPDEWISLLNRNNILCNNRICKILYFKNSAYYFLKSFLKCLKLNFIRCSQEKEIIFIDNIPNNIFPTNQKDENFFIGIKKFLKINKKISFFHGNKKLGNFKTSTEFELKYKKDILFSPNNNYSRLINFVMIIRLFFKYLFSSHKKNFASFFLFYDIILAELFKKKKISSLIYIGNEIQIMTKPLWSLEAEKKNFPVYILLYSTNNFKLPAPKELLKVKNQWGANLYDWKKYIVFCKEQKNFINHFSNKSEIFVINDIFNFEGKSFNIKKKKNFIYISLFEVTPYNDHLYNKFFPPFKYWTPEITIKFYLDIFKSVENYENIKFLIKPKRLSKDKINVQDTILKFKNYKKKVILFPSEINPVSLIKKSDIVFSMPFTSTAFIARSLKKNTFFYDCLDKIDKNHFMTKSNKDLGNIHDLKKSTKAILK